MAQDGVPLTRNGVQNFLPAPRKQVKINGEFAIDFADQGNTLPEPVMSAFDFELHHLAKRGSILFLRDRVFRNVETPEILERQINSAFFVIDRNVLPEICQLKGGAGVVGKLLALGIAVSAEIKYEMSNGISRVAAIAKNIVEGVEARDGLILTEGNQEIRKLMLGNVELPYRFR